MALVDSAVLVPGTGYIYDAVVGTARPTYGVTPVVDEVQVVTEGGSGLTSFTLTYSGQTTASIAAAASAATVQNALVALSNVAPGDVIVTGANGGPYTVTFSQLLGGSNVTQMTATPTGGTGTVTVTTSTGGGGSWRNLGHTSNDDQLSISRSGGDVTVLGTWQNNALRSRTDPTTFTVGFTLLQMDNTALDLYFGTPGDVSGSGVYGVTGTGAPTERALFVRLIDGASEADLYFPKVSIAARDDITVDPQNFLGFPLAATVLQVTGSNLLEFLRSGLGT